VQIRPKTDRVTFSAVRGSAKQGGAELDAEAPPGLQEANDDLVTAILEKVRVPRRRGKTSLAEGKMWDCPANLGSTNAHAVGQDA